MLYMTLREVLNAIVADYNVLGDIIERKTNYKITIENDKSNYEPTTDLGVAIKKRDLEYAETYIIAKFDMNAAHMQTYLSQFNDLNNAFYKYLDREEIYESELLSLADYVYLENKKIELAILFILMYLI